MELSEGVVLYTSITSYEAVIIFTFVNLSTGLLFLVTVLFFLVEFGDDMCGRLLLFWSTDYIFDGNLFLWRNLRFLISRVGEIVVVL